MRIAVLKGSPNVNGSSNMLADNFIKGASNEFSRTVGETVAKAVYEAAIASGVARI